MKKQLIRPEIDNNKIKIPGTDELGDASIFLQVWPKEGVHAGVYKWVEGHLFEIAKKLDSNTVVYIEGHSLGGSIGIELGRRLALLGYSVVVKAQGAFPCYTKDVEIPPNLVIVNYEYGNDPITRIIKWFKHLEPLEHTGPERVWWKVPIQFFRKGLGDHVGYWG